MDQPWLIVSTLGAVFFIFAYIRYKSSEKERLKQDELAELEQSFDQLAREIEEDNLKVLRYVSEYKEKHDQQTRMLKSRIDMLEKELMALKSREEDGQADRGPGARAAAGAVPAGSSVPSAGASAASAGASGRALTPVPSGAAASLSASPAPSPAPSSGAEVPPRQETGSIAERYKTVFDLYRSGKSIEYIARKTDMPKGEIQLILQLAQKQEETYRAQG